MTRDELARLLDHSVLKPEAKAADLDAGAQIVRQWRVSFYCVQPCWVRRAAGALRGCDARVVSVVGFPHGCDRSDVKARATALAVEDGASEIDMVANLGALAGGDATLVTDDIRAVVRAAGVPVKVILETGALGETDKRLGCRIAVDAGAAFVKTSTGFHPGGGATSADVRLLRECVGDALGVKAAGGIRTLADVRAMLAAGASRIGTSSSVAILGALDA